MKRKMPIVALIAIAIVSVVIGLLLHELGHLIMALACGCPVKGFHIGVNSYVEIDVATATSFQLAIISLGSFIIPEIIYLCWMKIKNPYFVSLRIFTAMNLYVGILLSIAVLLKGTNQPETYDILMFQNYTGVGSPIIIVVLLLVLLVNIILEVRCGGVSKLVDYLIEKLDG